MVDKRDVPGTVIGPTGVDRKASSTIVVHLPRGFVPIDERGVGFGAVERTPASNPGSFPPLVERHELRRPAELIAKPVEKTEEHLSALLAGDVRSVDRILVLARTGPFTVALVRPTEDVLDDIAVLGSESELREDVHHARAGVVRDERLDALAKVATVVGDGAITPSVGLDHALARDATGVALYSAPEGV
jgi:hypothetical protein